MKRFLFCLMALFMAVQASDAKTIHWLTFIDTTDSNVGEIDLNTRKLLYSRWVNIINAALGENGYKSNVLDVYGQYTSPENCKLAIERLQCAPDDIIMFYYVGHGGRAINDTAKYPQMCLAQSNNQKYIPLEWVHDELKKKQARLTITIGMCCNSESSRITPKKKVMFDVNYGNTYVSSKGVQNIQHLFLDYAGDIIASSSSPKQTSGAVGTDLGPTDYYTYAILTLFDELASVAQCPTWDELFGVLNQSVEQWSASDNRRQTPQCDINVRTKARPAATKPAAPSKETVQHPRKARQTGDTSQATPEEKAGLAEVITLCLDNIVSTHNSEEERLDIAEKFTRFFTTDAEVKILSQDGNIVIDKEDIHTFVGRISTSRLLYKVIMDNGTINKDGLISQLKVYEIYKK